MMDKDTKYLKLLVDQFVKSVDENPNDFSIGERKIAKGASRELKKLVSIARKEQQQSSELEEAEKAARYWQLGVAKLSVQQEKYAELGRLFAKCSVECEKENCRIDICDIAEACQKRAELLGEGRQDGQ